MMKPLLFISLMCGLCVPLRAQIVSLPSSVDKTAVAQNNALALSDAFAAFENGDQTGGLAKLNSNLTISAPAATNAVQTIGQLNQICFWLADEQHPQTAATALVAVGEMEKARSKLTGKAAATALATEGGLYERILGDTQKANASYTLALQFDPKQPDALRGLARLRALDAMIKAKARENETLRQRALQPKS